MASLISTPKAAGRGQAMEELDRLLQDLYVANNEENRLIQKEKQHIQALETAIQERQKLIQNHQKITSQTDKDIKLAHQQFKHNRANCESLKSHYSVLQQHLNTVYKKQEEVNAKWKDKRADLSRSVDQYEGTWQTYQAKYEESELAIQLLDMESQVTLVNNRMVNAQKKVEQLRNSIAKLQQLDTHDNQIFKSLNAFIIRIAEVKHASNMLIRETDDKQLKIEKMKELGQGLQQQEKQLCQQLEEVQIAKREQERLRNEKERIEAEKQRKEEQAARQREIPTHNIQGKLPYRNNTPGTNGNNLIQYSSSITNTANTNTAASWTSHSHQGNTAIAQPTPPPQHSSSISNTANTNTSASWTSHSHQSNAAIAHPIPPPQQARKSPPFIQMPVLSSSSSSSSSVAQQTKLTTSLGVVDKGVKTSTAPPRFTLQVPALNQQQQQQQQKLTSQAAIVSQQSLTGPTSDALQAPSVGNTSTVTVTVHQILEAQQASSQESVTSSKQPEAGEPNRPTPPLPQAQVATTLASPVSYPNGTAINETSGTQDAIGNNTASPTNNMYQQQQQQVATPQPLSYNLPATHQQAVATPPQQPSYNLQQQQVATPQPLSYNLPATHQQAIATPPQQPNYNLQGTPQPASYNLPLPAVDNGDVNSKQSTPNRGIFSYEGHRKELEAIKSKSPGFVLPSRPMFDHGDQVNPAESEAMESTTSSSNFQDFSSIFSGNSFSQMTYQNSPDISQMFASPQVSSANDKRSAESSNQSFGGFMAPPSKSMSMNFNSPSDMFGNPSSPMPSNNSSGGGALSMFGGGGDADSRQGATNSPAGFSFSFGGGSDSPRTGGSSSQPFSLF